MRISRARTVWFLTHWIMPIASVHFNRTNDMSLCRSQADTANLSEFIYEPKLIHESMHTQYACDVPRNWDEKKKTKICHFNSIRQKNNKNARCDHIPPTSLCSRPHYAPFFASELKYISRFVWKYANLPCFDPECFFFFLIVAGRLSWIDDIK